MNRVLRSLAVAFLAMGLLFATAGSAVGVEFEYESGTTSVTGTQGGVKDKLITAFGTIECNTAKYTGAISGSKAALLTLTPTYEDCTPALGTTTVTMNGCDYVLNAGETVGTSREGSLDIVCPAEKQIVVHVAVGGTDKCTITVPGQKAKTTVRYDNGVSKEKADVKATLNVQKISYTEVEGSGLGACPANAANTGEYTGEWTLEVATKAGISIDKSETAEFNFNFEAGASNATAQSTGATRFTTTFAPFECTASKATGSVSETKAPTLSLSPTYEGCSVFFYGAMNVTLNGCEYVFKAIEKTKGSFDIVCPSGKQIVIDNVGAGTSKCTITIPPQTGKAVTYGNGSAGGKEDVTLSIATSSIEYSEDPGTGINKCASGTSKTGSFEATWTLSAEDSKGNLKNVSVG